MLFFGGAARRWERRDAHLAIAPVPVAGAEPLKKILITSALPKEGKSFLAATSRSIGATTRPPRSVDRRRFAGATIHELFGSDLRPAFPTISWAREMKFPSCSKGRWKTCSSFRRSPVSNAPDWWPTGSSKR